MAWSPLNDAYYTRIKFFNHSSSFHYLFIIIISLGQKGQMDKSTKVLQVIEK